MISTATRNRFSCIYRQAFDLRPPPRSSVLSPGRHRPGLSLSTVGLLSVPANNLILG